MAHQNYRDPTEAEYATILRVFTTTGIMTVKDKVTANFVKPQVRCGGVPWEKPWQNMRPYGEDYPPSVAGTNAHETGFSGLTLHRRAIRIDHFGTPQLPDGIPIGGVEIWTKPDVFGMKPSECVKWQPDIAPGEDLELGRWARNIHHVTDAEYSAQEQSAALRRQNMTATQQDPTGALVKALAPALKELLAGKSEKSEGPSEDQLRAAGFFKKPDGSWGRLQPEGAGAK